MTQACCFLVIHNGCSNNSVLGLRNSYFLSPLTGGQFINALASKTRLVLISFALTILSACDGRDTTDNGAIKVTAITISPQIASVSKGGDPLQLTATITPANATNKAVVWASSDNTIISVSSTGLLTANVDSGSATVTATAQDGSGIKGSITVNAVPKGSIKVTAITLSPQNPWVSKGGKSVQLTAVITPANAANKAITWASSNNATIKVSNTGLVTANVKSGSVSITATAQDGSGIRGNTTVTALPPFCSPTKPCLHVTSDTSANGDGSSWTSPLPGLQAALDKAKAQLAQANNPPLTVKILLKAGTYRPSKKADGTACVVDTTYSDCTFVMRNNVEIYGGFAGTETSLADRVLNAATITYLDGLLNPSATVTACATDTVNAKCSTRVITNNYTATAPLTASAILDGVVVRNGRGLKPEDFNNFGGGMFNSYASPTIRNVTFSGNVAHIGGAMGNDDRSSPLLTNVTFSGNAASGSGGGMQNSGSSPLLINVTFTGNYAGYDGGGGMDNRYASPLLINVTFLGNSSNSAQNTGNKNVANDVGSRPVFVNTVVWGDGILNFNSSSSYTAYSSLIQGVAADTNNGNLDGVTATTAGIFGNPAPALADNGNPFVQTFAIATNGPAANNGALVWKSGADYYATKGNDIFKITGTGTGKINALPAGATLISTGGANKNNTVTPTAGPPAVYPDLGAYQH